MAAKSYAPIAVAVVMASFIAAVAVNWPLQSLYIIVPAVVIPYVVWFRTTYQHPVESKHVIAIYLLAVSFQMVHMAEEYLAGFAHVFSVLCSTEPWSEESFLLIAVFTGMALYTAAGAGMLYRNRVANYFVWYYALGFGMSNAIAHFVFPIIAWGYFPGLYTASMHLVLSVALVIALVKEYKTTRAQELREGIDTTAVGPVTVTSDASPANGSVPGG